MIRTRTALYATRALRNSLRFALVASSHVSRRAFSAAAAVFDAQSDAKSELASALRSELKLEQETATEAAEAATEVKAWADEHHFEIISTHGNEQIQLVKKISDYETIRVFFSISDVVNAEDLLDEDPLAHETEGHHSAEEEEVLDTPIRVNIVVEKSNGALSIEGVVQDDLVLVENVIPYASSKLALEESANAEYSRRQAYQGPPFGVLDPSIQSAVQQYLESRELDGDFALFVQEYASFRENKEYAEWLGKIAEIVES